MINWDKVVQGPLMGVFGEAVRFMPFGGTPFNTSGVFDEAYRDVELAGGMGVTTEQPMLGVRLSTFPASPAQDDLLTILRTGETFKVKEVRPDGHGWAKLMLNLAS
ncbi:hypothetical protein [Janthinobacterium sp.]|uniref:head-tail joining protein n=1 Tax=Janthinobacterium sp. TaxID=1871054 RepID=UPI00293D2867|nr:hypothetical protein [Janthinobacterium sp.]